MSRVSWSSTSAPHQPSALSSSATSKLGAVAGGGPVMVAHGPLHRASLALPHPAPPHPPAHAQHHPWQIALSAWPLSGLGPSSPLLFPKPLRPSPPPGPGHNLPPECSQALLRGLCTLPLFVSNSFTCNSSNLIQKYFLWLCCL